MASEVAREIPGSIIDSASRFTELRRWVHQHPELGFEETRTSDLVAQHLREHTSFEVTTGIATTGVVATLRKGSGARSIGLRADMDALPITEANTFAHRSRHAGRFHGCGHDGHTAMLLAAAEAISDCDFDGTVHLIFQPAEEGLGGGRAMINEGLFERFPCDRIFGMHNLPGRPLGTFAIRPGPMLASSDRFTLTINGRGGHVGMPHWCVDPVMVASHIAVAWQSMLGRRVDPTMPTTMSVTRIAAGEVDNAIPDAAHMMGSIRTTDPDVHDRIGDWMHITAEGIAAGFGATVEFKREIQNPPLVNCADCVELAVNAARRVVGPNAVDSGCGMLMGAEDFAHMLRVRPGAYIFLGNGEGRPMVHDPHYDFNDEALPIGAAWWVSLVDTMLGPGSGTQPS